MTVLENVLIGCHSKHHAGFLRNAFRLPGLARIEADALARAHELIAFVELSAVADRTVADLPFGTQSAWSWRARWRPSRNCCCSTSGPAA